MNCRIVQLREVTNNLDGKRKPLNEQQRNEIKGKGKYPYYGANGVIDYIDSYIFDEKILCIAEDGGSWGYKDKCSYIVNEKCWVNNHAHVLTAKEYMNLEYLRYYLNYDDLSSFITGTTRGKLTKKSLENIKIPLPPMETQKKIAEVLDKSQELIDKRKEQIEKLDQFLQSVFLDMFGDPVKNPKGWEIKNFKEGIREIKYGTSSPPNFTEKGINFIRATNIKKGRIIEKQMKYITEDEGKKIEKCKLETGDIIIVRSGVNTGDSAYIPEIYHGSYGGYDLIVKLRESMLHYVYIIALLNSSYLCKIIKPLTRRAAQPHLNSKQIQDLNIIYPPLDLQNKFAQIVEKTEQQKELLHKSLTEMENNFNSILQKAFKGELFN